MSRPKLSRCSPPFRMFLSATASAAVVKLVASRRLSPNPAWHKPKLFVHCLPLPPKHFYLVEQKTNLDRVASRIAEILAEYNRTFMDGKAKAVCYFVSRERCRKFKKRLVENHGISSNVFVRAETPKEQVTNRRILKEFNTGKIQVLCANSALGRGVDDLPKDIRFCFHVEMPASLGK